MPIDPNCHKELIRLGLPMTVDVLAKDEKTVITQAEIHSNGTITDLTTGIKYDQPSALRQDIVVKNKGTYKYLVLNGTTLHDLGVKP